jgi:predicted MPP superfamily phosphohydrolase
MKPLFISDSKLKNNLPSLHSLDKKTRIVFISDTHLMHRQLTIPDCHILVHCGDIVMRGVLQSDEDSIQKYKDFNRWLGSVVPDATKIVIGGNHDFYLEKIGPERAQELLFNSVYLQNSCATINGVTFFGSPLSKSTSKTSKSFQDEASRKHFMREFLNCEQKIDVLITHSGDILPHEEIRKKNIQIHAWGHFHDMYGIREIRNNFVSLCASSINGIQSKKFGPIVFDL